MRIIHANKGFFGMGGEPYNVRALARAHWSLGHDVLGLGAPRFDFGSVPTEYPFRAAAIERGIATISAFRMLLKREEFEVGHIQGILRAEHTLWAREFYRADIPYVVTPRNIFNPHTLARRAGGRRNIPGWRYAKTAYLRAFDTQVLRHAQAVHLLSPYEETLARQFGASRTFVHPYGIDPPAEWEITYPDLHPRDRVVFLFLGRLDVFQKGLDILAEAWHHVRLATPYKVVIAGPDSLGSRAFIRAITAAVPPKNLEIVGPVDGAAKARLFREAHFLLHPSRWEVMARTARESLARAVPLVASVESNFGEWVRINNVGVVTELSAESLAHAIERAASISAEDYRIMARNSRNFAIKHGWTDLAAALVNVYKGRFG